MGPPLCLQSGGNRSNGQAAARQSGRPPDRTPTTARATNGAVPFHVVRCRCPVSLPRTAFGGASAPLRLCACTAMSRSRVALGRLPQGRGALATRLSDRHAVPPSPHSSPTRPRCRVTQELRTPPRGTAAIRRGATAGPCRLGTATGGYGSSKYLSVSAPSRKRKRARATSSRGINRAFTPIRSTLLSTADQCVTQPQFRQRWNAIARSSHI